ncbi:UDP-N-acetylglucosamine transporter TMEM241 homolog [Ptychodera flava]|uniref:UDP-N-acetylglucosamine transporter TMEM241 homolog n=1 Tax=Ptychodera flava TaxID=63121 RepID=UPI003969E534
MAQWLLICTFVGLYIATNFTNKYVLSVLQFTFPTIFQGWQTLVGYLLLTLVGKWQYVDRGSISKSSVKEWLPAGILYVGVIYSGSKALSKLAIPVFVIFQNTTHNTVAFLEWAYLGKIPSFDIQFGLLWMLVSALLVLQTDPQFHVDGYIWMALHVLCSSFYTLYTTHIAKNVKLSEVNKLYCNYFIAVVILIPLVILLGDAFYARNFPFWFYYRFHTGCVFSGIFGTFLNLSMIKLTDILPSTSFNWMTLLARVLLTFLSFFIFEFYFTTSFLICVMSGIFSDIAYVYTRIILHDDKATTWTPTEVESV